jgi:hypothetical protein
VRNPVTLKRSSTVRSIEDKRSYKVHTIHFQHQRESVSWPTTWTHLWKFARDN